MEYAFVFQDIKRMELDAILSAHRVISMGRNVLDVHKELILGLVKKFACLVTSIAFHANLNLLVLFAKMDFM